MGHRSSDLMGFCRAVGRPVRAARAHAADGMVITSSNLLAHVPVVALLTAAGSLLGGVYLLLRYDAGGQQVEDLWQAEPRPRPPLPSIPSQSIDSKS